MTVPAINGKLNDLVLACAKLLGIDEIYKIGGAQAVAALAFGTKKIEKVDKIVGPGNAFVATAKKSIWKCRYRYDCRSIGNTDYCR